MQQDHSNKQILTGLIVTHFIAMNIAYWALSYYFDFPEILRRSPDEILALYRSNEMVVRTAYYLFTLTGLSLLAIAFYIFECSRQHSSLGRLAMIFGCIAGLFTSIGFVRWTFVIPEIARLYAAAALDDPLLPALEADLRLIHGFAGIAIGENLAFVLQGLWLLLLGFDLCANQQADKGLSLPCVGLGLLVLVYSLEQFGGVFSGLAQLNVYIQASWLVWMLMLARAMTKADRTATLRLDKTEYVVAAISLIGLLSIL